MRNEKLVLLHLSTNFSANDHRINSLIDISVHISHWLMTVLMASSMAVAIDRVRRGTVPDAEGWRGAGRGD